MEEKQLIIPDKLLENITKFEAQAKNIVITGDAERDTADETLKFAGSLKKTIEQEFEDVKQYYYNKHREVSAFIKSYTDRVESARTGLKKAILAYDMEQEKKREAERIRLQAIADEQARKERERLEKQAAKVKTPEKREALLAQAEMIESAPVVQVQEPDKPKNSSYIRSEWKHEVINLDEVPRQYLIANDKLLSAIATNTKGMTKIPGVKFFEEKILVSGRS